MAKEKAKSSNKLKIAVIVLAIALIAAVGGIFGVYAATQQNVNTSFSVQYSIGKNVAVAIGAKTSATPYNGAWNWVWFEADKELTKNANNLYEIGINKTDQDLSLALPEENNGVVNISVQADQLIVFYFENLSDKAINCTMSDNCTIDEGLGVNRYYGFTTDTTTPPVDATTRVDLSKSIQIPAGQICVIYIQVGLDGTEFNKNLSYTSDENGGISFVFEQA